MFERVILVHGVRNRPELAYGKTLGAISERQRDRFRFLPTLSREDGGEGRTGRITDLLRNGVLEDRAADRIDAGSSHVMLCGNAEMIKETRSILEGRGLRRHSRRSPGQYSTEQYH
jgi:ferredoxin--NADP+ reductase